MLRPPELAVRWVLCDADGTLFPSEEPAFEASAAVVNAVLDAHGVPGDVTGDELRRVASGRDFRSLVPALLESSGQRIEEDELARWAERENAVVTQRLITCLRPDPAVDVALGRLGD